MVKTAVLEACAVKESKQHGTTASERTKMKEVFFWLLFFVFKDDYRARV